jgi:hypothetical protein
MVLVWETSMSEAVRTMASPAATWAIVVIATILALFMATAAMFMDLHVARTQRRERMLGIAPEAGDAWAMEAGSEWPRLSQALLAAAGVRQSEAAQIRSGPPTADAAGRHDIPAQRAAPAEQPEPAATRAEAARAEAARYAAEPQAEPPTVPIPAQRAQVMEAMQGTQDDAAGRHTGPEDAAVGGEMPTRPDLPAQQAPGRPATGVPTQRTGESDRAERSFAGPAPQDEDEGEQ